MSTNTVNKKKTTQITAVSQDTLLERRERKSYQLEREEQQELRKMLYCDATLKPLSGFSLFIL